MPTKLSLGSPSVPVRVERHRDARDAAVPERARVLARHVRIAAACDVGEHEGDAVGPDGSATAHRRVESRH